MPKDGKVSTPREMPSPVNTLTFLGSHPWDSGPQLSILGLACQCTCICLTLSFSQVKSLKKRKLLLEPLVWHPGKDSRGLFIYLVTGFSMLNKFCSFAIAILCVAYSLSNALDPSLLLQLWVWSPVGGLFWVFNDLEAIEQQSCSSPSWVLRGCLPLEISYAALTEGIMRIKKHLFLQLGCTFSSK